MKSPVAGRAIFEFARPAQRKPAHGRCGTFVGHRFDDRIARPARSATGQRIKMSSIADRGHILQALAADRDVGRHLDGERPLRAAGNEDESRAVPRTSADARSISSADMLAGSSSGNRSANRSTASASPSTRITTPAAVFPTSPDNWHCEARRGHARASSIPCTGPRRSHRSATMCVRSAAC